MTTGKEAVIELLFTEVDLASACSEFPCDKSQGHAEPLIEHTILPGTSEPVGGKLMHWTLSIIQGADIVLLGIETFSRYELAFPV